MVVQGVGRLDLCSRSSPWPAASPPRPRGCGPRRWRSAGATCSRCGAPAPKGWCCCPTPTPSTGCPSSLARFDGLLLRGRGRPRPGDLRRDGPGRGVRRVAPPRRVRAGAAARRPGGGPAGPGHLPGLPAAQRGPGRHPATSTSPTRETTVHHRGHLHAVEVEQGCRLAAAVGAGSVEGWSMHHQAVDRLGRDLVVTARADDGVIEARRAPRGLGRGGAVASRGHRGRRPGPAAAVRCLRRRVRGAEHGGVAGSLTAAACDRRVRPARQLRRAPGSACSRPAWRT